jgi:hypothetical protein
MANGALTVRELVAYLRPSVRPDTVPHWPPDAFALALSVLRHADAYSTVVSAWPPGRRGGVAANEWAERIRRVAMEWRRDAARGREAPAEVREWWRIVAHKLPNTVSELRDDRAATQALLQLVATADEASNRAGIWNAGAAADAFRDKSLDMLIEQQSLGRDVHPSRAVIFPKLHTPQRGITVRSLTHYLALHEPRDVIPRWYAFPFGLRSASALNLLVLPWPEHTVPRDFSQTAGLLLNMPAEGVGTRGAYGFFTYAPHEPPVTIGRVRDAIRRAKGIVGNIDAVVFPELALDIGQADAICRSLGILVIGGEGRAARNRVVGMNRAAVSMPLQGIARGLAGSFVQPKHHRWCVDASQVLSYGLGAILDPSRDWWEHIGIERRELHFFELSEWLTFCVLICEDLARQEPVSELIRAVGPNLVITLLMDGPQLEHRWPAKYATVLAEDPGSSVLTVTSLGMSRSSRPPGKTESRAVALWKDPLSGGISIEMPDNCDGVVLCLTRERTRERTADGRDDDWGSDYIRLNGVHPAPRETA